MRIWAWALGYWDNAEQAHQFDGTWRSWEAWKERVDRCLKPTHKFISCGSWSDPKLVPISDTAVVNAGLPKDRPYYGQRWHYGKAAFISAMAYALNRADEWDYLVTLDTDALIGVVDFPKLFAEFESRKEILLAPGWCHLVGGPIMIFKRWAAIRLLHHRPYISICDDSDEDMPMWETECLKIFSDGRWWNPWPQHDCLLHEGSWAQIDPWDWPFCGRPQPRIIQRYLENHIKGCVPLK